MFNVDGHIKESGDKIISYWAPKIIAQEREQVSPKRHNNKQKNEMAWFTQISSNRIFGPSLQDCYQEIRDKYYILDVEPNVRKKLWPLFFLKIQNEEKGAIIAYKEMLFSSVEELEKVVHNVVLPRPRPDGVPSELLKAVAEDFPYFLNMYNAGLRDVTFCNIKMEYQ